MAWFTSATAPGPEKTATLPGRPGHEFAARPDDHLLVSTTRPDRARCCSFCVPFPPPDEGGFRRADLPRCGSEAGPGELDSKLEVTRLCAATTPSNGPGTSIPQRGTVRAMGPVPSPGRAPPAP